VFYSHQRKGIISQMNSWLTLWNVVIGVHNYDGLRKRAERKKIKGLGRRISEHMPSSVILQKEEIFCIHL